MRVVLYAHDMEPITILELEARAYAFLLERGMVRLPVKRPMKFVPSPSISMDDLPWQVTITAERLAMDGEVHLLLFTRDEEQALLLKAAFLPGQVRTLKEHERKAFADGFMYALSRIGE